MLNAFLAILEAQIFKNFQGEHARGPPYKTRAFGARDSASPPPPPPDLKLTPRSLVMQIANAW